MAKKPDFRPALNCDKGMAIFTLTLFLVFQSSFALCGFFEELVPGDLERAILEAPRRQKEERLSHEFQDVLHNVNTPIVNDPRLIGELRTIVDRITSVTTRKDSKFQIRIVQDEAYNAYVMGGEFIYMNLGFLKKALSEDEIAGVLAHEIGHVIAGHQRREDLKNTWADMTHLIAQELTEKHEKASEVISEIHEMLSPLFSREHEKEADILGAYFMYEAGFKTTGLVSAFQLFLSQEGEAITEVENRLQQASEDYDEALKNYNQYNDAYESSGNYAYETQIASNQLAEATDYYNAVIEEYQQTTASIFPVFRTHPVNEERIKTVQLVSEYKQGRISLQEMSSHDAEIAHVLEIVERTKVYQERGFISEQGEKAIDALKKSTKLLRKKRYSEVISCLEEPRRNFPDFWEAHYNVGVAYTQLGKLQEAESALNQALRLQQESYEIKNALSVLKVMKKE